MTPPVTAALPDELPKTPRLPGPDSLPTALKQRLIHRAHDSGLTPTTATTHTPPRTEAGNPARCQPGPVGPRRTFHCPRLATSGPREFKEAER